MKGWISLSKAEARALIVLLNQRGPKLPPDPPSAKLMVEQGYTKVSVNRYLDDREAQAKALGYVKVNDDLPMVWLPPQDRNTEWPDA